MKMCPGVARGEGRVMVFSGGFGRLVGLVWRVAVGSPRPVGWSW